jgi:hypothetical protein
VDAPSVAGRHASNSISEGGGNNALRATTVIRRFKLCCSNRLPRLAEKSLDCGRKVTNFSMWSTMRFCLTTKSLVRQGLAGRRRQAGNQRLYDGNLPDESPIGSGGVARSFLLFGCNRHGRRIDPRPQDQVSGFSYYNR